MARFEDRLVDAIDRGKIIGLRVGDEHRFIGLWVVVVEKRVFVRSWSLTPEGWYRASEKERSGAINVDGKELEVRLVRTRSERLKDAVSAAYREKYHTPASLKYVKDLSRKRSRDTTTELVPA